MKALFGQAPNLLWWRLQHMTDAEIQEFNGKYVREVEMSDDKIFISKDEVFSGRISDEKVSALAKLTAKQISKQGYVAGELVTQEQTWNAALDAAIKIAMVERKYTIADEIRKLKK